MQFFRKRAKKKGKDMFKNSTKRARYLKIRAEI